MLQWFEVAPYRFHYFTAGRSSQFPLLFLHGFLGDYQEFSNIITVLQKKFYCVAVDLPGHGQTVVRGDDDAYTMAKTAIALIQFLGGLQIKKCGLIGYSMGGRLALYLGLHFPAYFSGVVLESASPGLKTETARQQRRDKDQEWIDLLTSQVSPFQREDRGDREDASKNSTLQHFLHLWYQQPLFTSLINYPQFEQLLMQRSQNNPQTLAKSLQYLGIGTQPNLWPILNQGKVPLSLLVGEQDHKFVTINQEILSLYPQANLSIFEDCGHNLHLENPTKMLLEIETFLSPIPY